MSDPKETAQSLWEQAVTRLIDRDPQAAAEATNARLHQLAGWDFDAMRYQHSATMDAIQRQAELRAAPVDSIAGDIKDALTWIRTHLEGQAPAAPAPIAVIGGTIRYDSFEFGAVIGAPGSDLASIQPTTFVMDSGAFEMALDTTTAAALGLPNLGAAQVGGVGGSANAYNTKVDLQLGWPTLAPNVYKDVSAVAIEGFGQNLFGLRFFISRGFALTLDPKAQRLTIIEG